MSGSEPTVGDPLAQLGDIGRVNPGLIGLGLGANPASEDFAAAPASAGRDGGRRDGLPMARSDDEDYSAYLDHDTGVLEPRTHRHRSWRGGAFGWTGDRLVIETPVNPEVGKVTIDTVDGLMEQFMTVHEAGNGHHGGANDASRTTAKAPVAPANASSGAARTRPSGRSPWPTAGAEHPTLGFLGSSLWNIVMGTVSATAIATPPTSGAPTGSRQQTHDPDARTDTGDALALRWPSRRELGGRRADQDARRDHHLEHPEGFGSNWNRSTARATISRRESVRRPCSSTAAASAICRSCSTDFKAPPPSIPRVRHRRARAAAYADTGQGPANVHALTTSAGPTPMLAISTPPTSGPTRPPTAGSSPC